MLSCISIYRFLKNIIISRLIARVYFLDYVIASVEYNTIARTRCGFFSTLSNNYIILIIYNKFQYPIEYLLKQVLFYCSISFHIVIITIEICKLFHFE